VVFPLAAKIGIFYVFFYLGLAGWFAGLLHAFYSTLDPTMPTYYGFNSLTQDNPGLYGISQSSFLLAMVSSVATVDSPPLERLSFIPLMLPLFLLFA